MVSSAGSVSVFCCPRRPFIVMVLFLVVVVLMLWPHSIFSHFIAFKLMWCWCPFTIYMDGEFWCRLCLGVSYENVCKGKRIKKKYKICVATVRTGIWSMECSVCVCGGFCKMYRTLVDVVVFSLYSIISFNKYGKLLANVGC